MQTYKKQLNLWYRLKNNLLFIRTVFYDTLRYKVMIIFTLIDNWESCFHFANDFVF